MAPEDCRVGLVGYGEVCPLGPFYLPAYAEGVRAGLRELAPHLLEQPPRGAHGTEREAGERTLWRRRGTGRRCCARGDSIGTSSSPGSASTM